MKTELSYADKKKFVYSNVQGEWNNEPDKIQWIDEETGFHCLARRNMHLGYWCGYVGVPANHPYFDLHYDDEKISEMDVHGGLTFSGHCSDDNKEIGICHITDDDKEVFWFGFDCGHGGDFSPGSFAIYKKYLNEPGDMNTYQKQFLYDSLFTW